MRLITQQLMMDKNSPMVIRSRLRAVTQRMGFHEVQRERIQIAASELMSNQIKFATGAGLFQVWEHLSPIPALDLFALDFGPGISDLSQALTDGFSTAQTLGRGLGSIGRAADIFDIYPRTRTPGPGPNVWYGTAAWARFIPGDQASFRHPRGLRTGRFLRALKDDLFNGDSIRETSSARFLNWIHLDGLGHGKNAAETAESLYNIPTPGSDPAELLATLNLRLAGGRGAMGLAVCLDIQARKALYAGLGDLALRCYGSEKPLKPQFPGGVLGRGGGTPGAGFFNLEDNTLICSSSDGIVLNPDIGDFPGLRNCHPQLTALFMGNILGRDHDDKSLFIAHFHHNTPAPPRSFP